VIKENVVFSCDDGYSLIGHRKITCEFFLRWNKQVPICKKKSSCKFFISAFNIKTWTIVAQNNFRPVSLCHGLSTRKQNLAFRLTLQLKWPLFPISSPQVVQVITGLVFIIAVCELPPPVYNGAFEPAKYNYYVGDSIRLVCYDGYKLQGSEFVQCLENGKWSDVFSECVGKL